MYTSTIDSTSNNFIKVLEDFKPRFIECVKTIKSIESNNFMFKNYENNLEYILFTQLWPNTARAFDTPGTISGQALSWSQNVIIISRDLDLGFVYLDKYIYSCKLDENFYYCLESNRFPGLYEIEVETYGFTNPRKLNFFNLTDIN